MAKQPKISTLARGTAEGAIVLELELGFGAADVGQVAQALDRYPGIWGIDLDPAEDWGRPAVVDLFARFGEALAMVSRAEFGELSWPEHDIKWVLDVSVLVRECPDDRALALRLGEPWLPMISDLVLDLADDQPPPMPATLTMLGAAIQPACAYVYVPIDYQFRALVVQSVAATSSIWSVRWIR